MRYRKMRTLASRLSTVSVLTGLAVVPFAPSSSASSLTITVTCTTPEKFRQLGPSTCLNSVSDQTQSYTATVRNGRGQPVSGVQIHFTDDNSDAHFRLRSVTCSTNRQGVCSSELKVLSPYNGEVVHTAATIVSTRARDGGKLVFTDSF